MTVVDTRASRNQELSDRARTHVAAAARDATDFERLGLMLGLIEPGQGGAVATCPLEVNHLLGPCD